jgi:hypothetical protein
MIETDDHGRVGVEFCLATCNERPDHRLRRRIAKMLFASPILS